MKVFRLTLMAAMALMVTLVSCEKPVPIDDETQGHVEVTYHSIEGCWKLTHLNGAVLHDDTELFIEFSNIVTKDDTELHRYKLLDNIGSMYPRLTTGSYTITKQGEEYILSGSYDNGVGDWNEEYHIVMPSHSKMQWRSAIGTCLEFKFSMDTPEDFNK